MNGMLCRGSTYPWLQVAVLRQISIVTEVSGRVAGLFYACRFPNQENTKFCVVQVDIENSVIKTDASTQSSFKGVLCPKKGEFWYRVWKNFAVWLQKWAFRCPMPHQIINNYTP